MTKVQHLSHPQQPTANMKTTPHLCDQNLYLSRESSCELESWRSSEMFSNDVQNRIRDLLGDACHDVEKLNSKISSVRDWLSALLAQRESEYGRILILRSAISPVKKIPAEILSEIFVLCGDEEPLVIPPQLHTFPWTLAHVCSRWRQTLWGTPDVWKNIEIRPKPPRILSWDNGPIPTAMRSIISCTKAPVALKLPRGINDSVVDVILGSPERFRTLDLGLDHHLFCKFLCLPHGSFSALETLDISIWGVDSAPPLYQTISFQSALNLRQVFFDIDNSNYYLPYILLLPWAQLTDVRILHMKIAPSAIYSTLQQCMSLTSVKLLVGPETTEPPTSPMSIHLPKLTSISLSCHRHDIVQWADFLNSFILPSLDEFSLRTPSNPWPQEAYISLVHRSACNPRVLSILDGSVKPGYVNPDDTNTLLQALPSLVEFSTSFVITPLTFKAIACDGLVPNLEHIKCRVCPGGLESFLDLMQHYSLSAPRKGLKSASIRCFPGVGEDDAFARFETLSPGYTTEGRLIGVSLI